MTDFSKILVVSYFGIYVKIIHIIEIILVTNVSDYQQHIVDCIPMVFELEKLDMHVN